MKITAAAPPLALPPESMRPDRAEVMNDVAAAPRNEIASGVTFECLVGEHNGTRRLTTGIVTFVPEAALSYHTHPFSESITVPRGEVIVEVEGRCYLLAPLDKDRSPGGRLLAWMPDPY